MQNKSESKVRDDKSLEKLGPYGFHTAIAQMRLEQGVDVIRLKLPLEKKKIKGIFKGSDPEPGCLYIRVSGGLDMQISFEALGNLNSIEKSIADEESRIRSAKFSKQR